MESANNYRETEYHKILKAEEVKMKTTENVFFLIGLLMNRSLKTML